MEGTAWQELCLQVLRVQHGNDLVTIPDTDRGDAGLEAFSLTGVAYQTYSPQGSLSVQVRYERQRDKMTTDVGKFIDNDAKLQRLLGYTRIDRWVLLVPVVDSRKIVEHATAQSSRLQAAGLSYAENTIRVLTHTIEEDYAAALRTVCSQGLAAVGIPDIAELDYSTVDTEQVRTMRGKLMKVPVYGDHVRLDKMVDYLLASSVQGQSHREYVRDFYPELDQRLESEFLALQNRVEFELPSDGHEPGRMLALTMELAGQVTSVMNANPLKSQQVAHGQVADWLMECPLDFITTSPTDTP